MAHDIKLPRDSVSEEDIAKRRDEVVKRMLATPPQPRPQPKKKKG